MSNIVTYLYPDGSGTAMGTIGWTVFPSGGPYWLAINEGIENPNDTNYTEGSYPTSAQAFSWSGSIINPAVNITYAELRLRIRTFNNITFNYVAIGNSRPGNGVVADLNSFTTISGNSDIWTNYYFPLNLYNPSGSAWVGLDQCYMLLSPPYFFDISALDIYISGTTAPTYNSIPLWTAANYSFSGINLYTAAANFAQTGINLYTQGLGVLASSINLYTVGPSGANNFLNLYLLGNLNSSGSINLYTQGPLQSTLTLPFYTAGPVLNSGSSSLNFFTWSSTTPAIFNNIALYTSSDGINRSVPLYTKGPPSAQINGAVNLYTIAAVKTLDASIPLFCQTVGSENSIQLYTQGRGIEDFDPNLPGGGTSIGNGVPLYIGGNGIGAGINLYVGANQISSGLNLYTNGVYSQNGSINFAVPNVSDVWSDSINFHSHGF